MTSRSTFHYAWTVLFAVFCAIVFHPSSAHAMNGHPIEGKDFWFTKGPNPDSTYFHVKEGVNVNSELLAEMLRMQPLSFRGDNPTKTLALCKLPRDRNNPNAGVKFIMREGIRSPEGRASNVVWESICPDPAQQYVYLVPGETFEITGRKYMAPVDQAQHIKAMRGCAPKDDACLLAHARALNGNVSEGTSAAPPAPAASPAPQAATPPPAPAAAPPTKIVLDSELDRKNSELTAQVAQRDKEIAELKAQLKKSTAASLANSKEGTATLDREKEKTAVAKAEADKLGVELRASNNRNAVSEKKLSEAKAKVSTLEKDKADLEAKKTANGTSDRPFWAAIGIAILCLAFAVGTLRTLSGKIRRLREENESLQLAENGKIADQAKIIEDQASAIGRQTAAEEQLVGTIARQTDVIGGLKTDVATLQSSLNVANRDLESAKAQLRETKKELEQAMSASAMERKAATEFEQRRQERKDRCAEVLEELKKIDSRPAEIRAELDVIRESKETLEAEERCLRGLGDHTGADRYTDPIARASDRITALLAELDAVSRTVDEAWREFGELLTQLAGVNVTNASLFAAAKDALEEARKERENGAEALARAQAIVANEEGARARLDQLFTYIGEKKKQVEEREEISLHHEALIRRLMDPLLIRLGKDSITMTLEDMDRMDGCSGSLQQAAELVQTYERSRDDAYAELRNVREDLERAQQRERELEKAVREAKDSLEDTRMSLAEAGVSIAGFQETIANQRQAILNLEIAYKSADVSRLPQPSQTPEGAVEGSGVYAGIDRTPTMRFPSPVVRDEFSEELRTPGSELRTRMFDALSRVSSVFRDCPLEVKSQEEMATLRMVSAMRLTAFVGDQPFRFQLCEMNNSEFFSRLSASPRAIASST